MKMIRRKKIMPFAALALIIGFAISVVALPSVASESPFPLEEWVPMRDGVGLHTLVFLPDPSVWGSGPYPTIVSITPYGIGNKTHPLSMPPGCSRTWQEEVANGYAVVHQDARGRFLSQGIDRIWYDTGQDGYDTIEWVANQSWCDGNIGLTGVSAGGIVTYLTAAEKPPHLTAIMPIVGSSSLFNDYLFRGGSVELNIALPWVILNSFNLSTSHLEYLMSLGLTSENIEALYAQLSLIWTDLKTNVSLNYPYRSVDSSWWMYLPIMEYPVISQLVPAWDTYMENLENVSWRDSFDTVDAIEVPGLHISGWFDMYPDSNLRAFTILQERVGNQKVFIYNGGHDGFTTRLPYDPYFRWWDHWLKGIDNGIMEESPVMYQTWGAEEWRLADTWPPSGVEYTTYYLHSNGSLSTDLPVNDENPISYVYDPNDPVPTRGGRMGGLAGFNNPSGSFDQRSVEPPYRDDVLVYTSDVLKEDVEITGKVNVHVSASSNCSDTDFIAKLIDVYPDGSTLLILDGVTRAKWYLSDLMEDGVTYQIPIDLGDVSVIFKAGHRIQVDITSSNFPARDRNTNTGNPHGTDSEEDILVANNTIYHDVDNPSYIVLSNGPPTSHTMKSYGATPDLTNSSIILLVMGFSAMALSLFILLKYRVIKSISKNLATNTLDKTVNVANPFPKRRKLIHIFLLVFPILAFLVTMGIYAVTTRIFNWGLMLTFFIFIASLSLIVVEVTPEIYQNARIFIKLIQRKASLGKGDLELLQALNRTLPRVGNYYLGLSILFMASATTLGYVWFPVYNAYYGFRQWLSAQISGLTPNADVLAHAQVLFMVMAFLFTLLLVFIQIIAWKARSKMLSHGQ